jgi:hypothetical protein
VCSLEHTIQACVFYRTHTLLSIHLDILNPKYDTEVHPDFERKIVLRRRHGRA